MRIPNVRNLLEIRNFVSGQWNSFTETLTSMSVIGIGDVLLLLLLRLLHEVLLLCVGLLLLLLLLRQTRHIVVTLEKRNLIPHSSLKKKNWTEILHFQQTSSLQKEQK